MLNITSEDVVCYLLGQSTPDVCKVIENRVETDEAFATEVSFVRAFLNVEVEPRLLPTTHSSNQSSHIKIGKTRRLLWRCAAGILLGIFSLGVAWAGWELVREKPLLEDHFVDSWGDHDEWNTPRRIVKVEQGHVRLVDRGYLVTRKEFAEPIKLAFRWQWNDLAGDFNYRDILSVALRTSGIPRPLHAFEITDGLVITFNATSGRVFISKGGQHEHFIVSSEKLKMPPQVWYDIMITDDGKIIKVFVAAPHIPLEHSQKPILEFQTQHLETKHHIAFFNREPLAGASFESWLDDIVIHRLKPGK